MNKITDKDLANRGVKGLPDVPGLTTEEMQRKLEEIAREILVPKVNEIIDNLIAVNSNLNTVKNPVLLFDIKSNTYSAGDLLGGRIDMSAYSGFIITYSTVSGGYYKTSKFTGDMKALYQWLEFTNNNGVHYYTGAQVRYNGLFIESVSTNKLYIDKLYGIPA